MTDFVNIFDGKMNIMFKCQMLHDVHPSNTQQTNLAQFLFSKLVLNYTFLTVLSHTWYSLFFSLSPASAKAPIFISFIDEWVSGILVKDIIPIKSHINLLQAA